MLVVGVGCAAASPEQGASSKPQPPQQQASASASAGASAQAAAPPVTTQKRKLIAAAMPNKLEVDGKLDEWPAEPNAPALLISVDESKLVLAVRWSKQSEVVVALATPAPRYPAIGWPSRGGFTEALTKDGCDFEQIPLIEGGWRKGRRNPPEVAAACHAVLTRHEEAADRYQARYLRKLRLNAQGVQLLGEASPDWMASAKHAASEDALEVQLPLNALPELRQAPLTTLLIAFADSELPADLVRPVVPLDPTEAAPFVGWTELALAKPVRFGRYADLLHELFQPKENWMGPELVLESFHPSDPERLRIVDVQEVASKPTGVAPKEPGVIGPPTRPDRPTTNETLRQIFTSYWKFGAVDVGLTTGSMLVTYVGDKFTGLSTFGTANGSAKVGEELHFFVFSPEAWVPPLGMTLPAHWEVTAVKANGTIVTPVEESWDRAPTSFSDRDFKRFGLRGVAGRKPKEVVWQWDLQAGRYVSTVKAPLSLDSRR